MDKKINGTVVAVARQWWLKINTKAVRMHTFDGAVFPHIIKVEYSVDGQTYTKRKWVSAGQPVPSVGSSVTLIYPERKPAKAKIL